MREVPVLDSAGHILDEIAGKIHFGRAEQKALYQNVLRLKAELAQRKPRRESTGTGNAPQKYIAPPASTQAVA
jgi:hypothetical protein